MALISSSPLFKLNNIEDSNKRNRIRDRLNEIFFEKEGPNGFEIILINTLTNTLSSDSRLEDDFWGLSKSNMDLILVTGGAAEVQSGLLMSVVRCGANSISLYMQSDALSSNILSARRSNTLEISESLEEIEVSEDFLEKARHFASCVKTQSSKNLSPRTRSGRIYRVSVSILVLLSEIYGEEIVIDLLNRCKNDNEQPLFVDFIRILDDWKNLKNYPVAWSAALVQNGVTV